MDMQGLIWENERIFFETYGRFCVSFEQVCFYMENGIRLILEQEGLTNGRIQEVLLAGYTAEPLLRVFQSLAGEMLSKNTASLRICSKLFNQVKNLIETRNDFIHSRWFLYSAKILVPDNSGVLAQAVKLYANKEGSDTKELIVGQTKFEEEMRLCEEVKSNLVLITRCIMEKAD